jgi:hypothetical protein
MGATFQREDEKEATAKAQVQEKDDGMAELMANLQEALSNLSNAISRPRVAVRDPKTGKPMYGRPMTDGELAAMQTTGVQ